jgi:hypothetical protein
MGKMSPKLGRRLAPAAAILLALAVCCPVFARDFYEPAQRSVSLGLFHPYLAGVTVADVDARFGRLRLGAALGGLNSAAENGPLFRAGYTFWQRPHCLIRFADVQQPGHENLTRIGLYGFLPEAYALLEVAPFLSTWDGPPYYKYFGSLTANIAVEYLFLRAHLAAGVGLSYERPLGMEPTYYGWYFRPALNAGITLGSFTVGF